MYASLGDIVFKALTGFDSLSDTRETKYAQQELIQGKPNLQSTGEGLNEFTMSINFHVYFCNPEEEYLRLNNARISREVLPFIWGNGFSEGDFVITKLDRTINDTDGEGNFIDISCNLTLLEFANANTPDKQLEQDKKNAFAISSNRPLPASINTQTDNPALSVCEENKQVGFASTQMDDDTNKLNDKVNLVTSGLIDKAQKFTDEIADYTNKINDQVSAANNSLGSINSLIGAYAAITNESPTLPAKITAVQGSLTAIGVQLTVLAGLPPTVADITDANSALSELTNTLVAIKTLKDNTKLLNDANASLAKAVATKRIMT